MFSPLLCSCVSVQVQARETKGKEGEKDEKGGGANSGAQMNLSEN